MAPRGVDHLAIECTVKALLVKLLVQTLTSPCTVLGGCVMHLEVIVVGVIIDPTSRE
jgi:hypothetical protein